MNFSTKCNRKYQSMVTFVMIIFILVLEPRMLHCWIEVVNFFHFIIILQGRRLAFSALNLWLFPFIDKYLRQSADVLLCLIFSNFLLYESYIVQWGFHISHLLVKYHSWNLSSDSVDYLHSLLFRRLLAFQLSFQMVISHETKYWNKGLFLRKLGKTSNMINV